MKKIIPILLLLTLLPISVSASESYSNITWNMTADHPLYNVKLIIENIQEVITFDKVALVNLQQLHIKSRIDELKYDAKYFNNSHVTGILIRIREKHKAFSDNIYELNATNKLSNASIEAIKTDVGRNNEEILTMLLNSPDMPEQSKEGLKNAFNNSVDKYLKAHQVIRRIN